jgi:hypothetical protein
MVTVMEPPALYEPDCPANPAADSGEAELVTKLFLKNFFFFATDVIAKQARVFTTAGHF